MPKCLICEKPTNNDDYCPQCWLRYEDQIDPDRKEMSDIVKAYKQKRDGT